MSDLIDRQALLDECLNHYEVGNIEQNCTMDWICKTVRNLPTASPWHRVEDTPELYELVPNKLYASAMLVMSCDGGYYIGRAFSDEKNGPVRWVKDGTTISPTNWMPIEPPKEDA